ncbi:arylesterase [Rhodocytophaga rosea]|uniref:arylesterase n=1 Tax=Rhodocytophaga rosea TaxID=2704465 RepID=UPI001E572648|nr:arylesterase [Rhodocytophaga rosea]
MPPRIKTILCFGNSLTAGYGLSSSQAYPALLQQKINAGNLPYQVINAGVNGETSAKGVQRIEQYLHQPIDVFLLELGINDLPRGIFPPQTSANLQQIIDKVRSTHPRCRMVLAGMEIPRSIIPRELSGFIAEPMIAAFHNVFVEIASRNGMAYIPFLLKGVAGNPQLNLYDRIHPNAAGQKILAENVWDVLSAVL